MKKQMVALAAAGLLLTQIGGVAFGASLSSARPDLAATAKSAIDLPEKIPEDAEDTLSFQNLESRMRKTNLTVLSLEGTLRAQKGFSRETAYKSLVDTINKMTDMSWALNHPDNPAAPSTNTAALDAQIEALRAQLIPLQEENYNSKLEQTERQLSNSMWQIISAGQTLYLNILSTEASLADLDRGLASLELNLKEMKLRYELGQVSQLALTQLENSKDSLLSQKKSLVLGLESMRANLLLLLGEERETLPALAALPAFESARDAYLQEPFAEALERSKETSYTYYAAGKALTDAEDSKDEAHKNGSMPYGQAAQLYKTAQNTYKTALKNYDLNFRSRYDEMADSKQAQESAAQAVALATRNLSVAEKKFAQGQISEKQLKTVQDEQAAAQASFVASRQKAFQAYYQYSLSFVSDAL